MKSLISIVGPTASGKTSLSLDLARHFNAPVISADSVQIYRGLDIGSGKVRPDEMGEVPHYLLDVVDPCEEFSAGMYERRVEELLAQLFLVHDVVLLVGGAGFYLNAVWQGMDDIPQTDPAVREQLNQRFQAEGLSPLVAELAEADPVTLSRIDRQNPVRVIRALEVFLSTGQPISHFRKQKQKTNKPYRDYKIGLEIHREELYERINGRVDEMLAEGLEGEVLTLYEQHGGECKGLNSVGYREFVQYFEGEHDAEEAVRLIKRNTRRYAKRQYTWFRRFDDIHWFHPSHKAEILAWLEKEMFT